MASHRVMVASCGKAHGIKGEVAVFADVPEVFVPGATVHTRDGPLQVSSVRAHQDHLLVGFVGVTDRNTAEMMRNAALSVDSDQLPELAQNEYWVANLIGREARSLSGERLGEVTSVKLGPQSRLVIAMADGEVEIPFVTALVPEVAADYIVIDPPAGL